jgi:hypothetical protein
MLGDVMDSELVKGVLAGVIEVDSLTKEELNYVQDAMELIKNSAMGYPNLGAGAGTGAGTVAKDDEADDDKEWPQVYADENFKKPSDSKPTSGTRKPGEWHQIYADENFKKPKLVKFDSNGQWSVEKAIKPGSALNYKVLNKPVQQSAEDTQTITYHDTKDPVVSGKQWKTSDTKRAKDPVDQKSNIREGRIGRAVKQGTVVDNRGPKVPASPKTAMETMQSRGQAKPLVKAELPKICTSCLKDSKHRDNPGTPKLKTETGGGKWWDCPTCKTTGVVSSKSPKEEPKTSLRVVKEEG